MADIDSCKVMIADFDKAEIKEANHPFPNEVQECSDLSETAHADKQVLLSVGLDEECIERLPFWATLLQQSQSKINGLPQVVKSLQTGWDKSFSPTVLLIKDIVKTYRFVYFDQEEILDQIRKIEEGDDQADFIQDCHDLVLIGRTNADALVKVNFDTTVLDQLEANANTLRDIRAKLNHVEYDKSDFMIARGKTFSLMKKDMDEVKRTGKYVYRDDPEHAKHYASKYDRLRQAAYRRKKNVKGQDEE